MYLLTYQPQSAPDRANANSARKQLKTKILKAMAKHLQEHGRRHYDLLRENPEFASVIGQAAGESGKRKFFRWLEGITVVPATDETRPHEGRQVAEDHAAWAKKVADKIAANGSPVDPSPAYIALTGADGRSKLNIVACAHQIFADIDLLRRAALIKDSASPDGVSVKDAALLDLSIRRAIKMLDTMTGVGHHMSDIDLNERFYSLIVDIVISEIPKDKQKAAMLRLKELNDNWGSMKASH